LPLLSQDAPQEEKGAPSKSSPKCITWSCQCPIPCLQRSKRCY